MLILFRCTAGFARNVKRNSADDKPGGGGRIKRLITLLLALALLFPAAPAEAAHRTKYKDKSDEAWLWIELEKHSPNAYTTAGILAYFWRESQYRSDSVSGWATIGREQGWDVCKTVRRKTDKGLADGSSRAYFLSIVWECGGYGLGQWYSAGYLEDLYDFAQNFGGSIGDAEMQCAFVFHSLRQNKKLWRRLKRCRDAERAGRLIAIFYDGTETGADYMGRKAARLYQKYGKED